MRPGSQHLGTGINDRTRLRGSGIVAHSHRPLTPPSCRRQSEHMWSVRGGQHCGGVADRNVYGQEYARSALTLGVHNVPSTATAWPCLEARLQVDAGAGPRRGAAQASAGIVSAASSPALRRAYGYQDAPPGPPTRSATPRIRMPREHADTRGLAWLRRAQNRAQRTLQDHVDHVLERLLHVSFSACACLPAVLADAT